MNQYVISPTSTADDFLPLAMSIHELLNRLPVTARSRDHPGIRVERGAVVDRSYSGPVLEEAIASNSILRLTPKSGAYQGVPVIVSPLRSEAGDAIGAIGVVDITGIFDLATLMEQQSEIIRQVCGSDPCPLPTESISAKR
jgi:hypothetical protein